MFLRDITNPTTMALNHLGWKRPWRSLSATINHQETQTTKLHDPISHLSPLFKPLSDKPLVSTCFLKYHLHLKTMSRTCYSIGSGRTMTISNKTKAETGEITPRTRRAPCSTPGSPVCCGSTSTNCSAKQSMIRCADNAPPASVFLIQSVPPFSVYF